MTDYPRLAPPASHERILVVAPHMDDESIAAAGYAFAALDRGATVFVAFLTAGDCSRLAARLLHRTFVPTPSQYITLGHLRIAEARKAMGILGVREEHAFVLGYPDRGLRVMVDEPRRVVRSPGTQQDQIPYEEAVAPGSPHTFENLLRDMLRVLELSRPTVVVAPVAFDAHSDHSATAQAVDEALSRSPFTPRRLGYLVHTSALKSLVPLRHRALEPPDALRSLEWTTFPLCAEMQRLKDAVLSTYKSQQPYTYLLRNSFVRSNELFYRYARAPIQAAARLATSFACALLSSSVYSL
jgi:LmbE family N-acetylglucosaminyl deacetylase